MNSSTSWARPEMLHIYVDADSCPVKDEVYKVTKRYDLEVTLVAAQWFRVPSERWIHLQVVKETGDLDAADDWIVEQIEAGDIVVSEDIILASRCLEKKARALNPRGRVFTPESIGEALATRELMADLREAGTITGGPAPFGKTDRSRFLQQLDEIVNAVKRGR
ncbi:MAG: YaiI/YqxD family protein [Longimicrobiales bacterium]|nr:YaiI/YqxD family protein [Longimicrobiales bacterium]